MLIAAWIACTANRRQLQRFLHALLLQGLQCTSAQPTAAVEPPRPKCNRPADSCPLAADAALGGSEYAHVVLDISAPAEVAFVPRAVHQHFGAHVRVGRDVRALGAPTGYA